MSIEEFKAKLASHDWLYYFSDDHRVWAKGEIASKQLKEDAQAGGVEFKRLYNAAVAERFHKSPFAKPYTFPFPGVQD